MKKVGKIKELEEKLKKWEKKLADRRLGYGEVVRTRFGDSYEDQLRDDVNAMESLVRAIKDEIELLKAKR